jgi:galactokinase
MIDAHARKHEMAAAFRAAHGRDAGIWVRAPGRVELMGSHTDYNEGCVLTQSIDRDTWIAAAPRDDRRVRLRSLNVEGAHEFPAEGAPAGARCEGWALYVEGVAMMLEQAGHPVTGADLLVHGTVPLASGLSSSASLEVAAATLFERLGGFRLDGLEKARLCQKAENRVVGVSCGLLDQYSSVMGQVDRALLLDCRDETHVAVDYPEALCTVVCDTGAPRKLTASGYDQRRAECEAAARFFEGIDPACRTLRDVPARMLEEHAPRLDPVLARRARFIIEEHARVIALAEAFGAHDRGAIGRLMAESFEGARSLFEIGVPAMDEMIEATRDSPGVVGARQTGAGFGGCIVALVQSDAVDAFGCEVAARYRQATGIEPAIHPTHLSAGAGDVEEIL